MAKTLQVLLTEMKAIQDAHRGKAMPEEIATQFDALAVEAKGWQDSADRDANLRQMEEKSRRVVDPIVPSDTQPETKTDEPAKDSVAGYVKFGDFVVAQKALGQFLAAGMPKTTFPLVKVKSFFEPLVPLNRAQIAEFKAVPTLGADIIEPTRVPEILRVTEQDRLGLRDVLNTSPTTKDAVIYTRLTSYTRAAAAVAHGSVKPEAALALDAITEPVRTIAVWMPVQNQQLSDYPALASLINNELLYDVAKHLEELIMYGSGEGQEFEGILVNSGVQSARSEVGDTLIDIARRGITDVRIAGYEPNAILVHPLDWETIMLEKGSDNRYVWVVVTESGVQRLWGITVVESIATQDYAGNPTEARNLLVGDFRRGATLWDREDASVSVGWINDQYVRNMRTILAEGRWAFGVTRPGAFRKYETEAAVTS